MRALTGLEDGAYTDVHINVSMVIKENLVQMKTKYTCYDILVFYSNTPLRPSFQNTTTPVGVIQNSDCVLARGEGILVVSGFPFVVIIAVIYSIVCFFVYVSGGGLFSSCPNCPGLPPP